MKFYKVISLIFIVLSIFLVSFYFPNGLSKSDQVNQNLKEITIKAISGLQYDLVRFQVKPGEMVKLNLINADEMTHNWVLTQPGMREQIVSDALNMADGEKNDYIPDSETIIASIPNLSPDESFSITFQAPETEGVYPYVCTYPGHGSVMYGAMYVTNNLMPPLANDMNIPEQRRAADAADPATKSGHPYPMIFPSMYRTFMPQSGPASIAVGMLGDISYCWDAGKCRFRYAWKGGFLDMERTWSGKGKERADIVGVVFYKEENGYPLRIGNPEEEPLTEFNGYAMKNRYPTFLYQIDGLQVKERILPTFDAP